MTDFIHEHAKEEQPAPPPKAPQEELPLDEKTGQKRVYGYIFILFIVAFSLLLWSFLMNQRSTDQVLSELRGNANTLQTTLDRNVALEQQNEALEQRLAALEAQVKELTERNKTLEEAQRILTEDRSALQTALAEAQETIKVYEEQQAQQEAQEQTPAP